MFNNLQKIMNEGLIAFRELAEAMNIVDSRKYQPINFNPKLIVNKTAELVDTKIGYSHRYFK